MKRLVAATLQLNYQMVLHKCVVVKMTVKKSSLQHYQIIVRSLVILD